MHQPDGVYEGNFSNGVKDGAGTFTFSNGDVYKGSWKDNLVGTISRKFDHCVRNTYVSIPKPDGEGSLTTRFNCYYEGSWKAGKKSGKGTLKLDGVGTYRGELENDVVSSC